MNTAPAITESKELSQGLMRPIASPREMIQYHESVTNLIRDALKDGVDYGLIPKTQKPTLYKAGAERLNIAFGTHPEYSLIEKEIDHDRENFYEKMNWKTNREEEHTSYGLYRYVYKCKIIKNNGQVLGEGEGSCSTMEAKYISRPRDTENTVCKMAQKRAFVAATLHAFGLSDRFTQDLEDRRKVYDDIEPEGTSFIKGNATKPVPETFTRATHEEKMRNASFLKVMSENDREMFYKLMEGRPFTPQSIDGVRAEIQNTQEIPF